MAKIIKLCLTKLFQKSQKKELIKIESQNRIKVIVLNYAIICS